MSELELYLAERAELLAGVERLREALQTEGYDTGASLEDVLDTARFAAAFRKPDDVRNGAALERIKAATQAAGWPVGESIDDLVAAVETVAAWRNRDLLVAERDALAADNARLLAELAALEKSFQGKAMLAANLPMAQCIDSISKALAAAGYAHHTEGAGAGHRSMGEIVECLGMALTDLAKMAADNERLMADSKALAAVDRLLVDAGRAPASGSTDIVYIVQGVADVLDERERLVAARDALAASAAENAEALARISTALTATGRDADSCGHGGPSDIADAVEEALLDLSARWRGRDEALERIREALGMPPANPADIANTAIRTLTALRAAEYDRVTREKEGPEDLYTMAMTLRSHADGSGDGVSLVELADIYARLQRRVDGWGRSRSVSEAHFCWFLKSVLEETAKWCSDTLPDAPATGGDCGGAA